MTNPDFDEDAAVEVEDLDVEVDDSPEDEVEASESTPAKEAKEPKEKKVKVPARPPVAEGYITPVAFAKLLTVALMERGVENKKGPINLENPVPPQMVYSYIRNNQGGKNPLPIYTDPAVTGGREYVLKPEEALEWWIEKDARIATSKAAKAEKDAKRKEKAAEATSEATESTEEVSSEAVEEAE